MFYVEAIVALLILHPQQEHQAAGDPEGETGNVDDGNGLVFPDVSQGDNQSVSQHARSSCSQSFGILKTFIHMFICGEPQKRRQKISPTTKLKPR